MPDENEREDGERAPVVVTWNRAERPVFDRSMFVSRRPFAGDLVAAEEWRGDAIVRPDDPRFEVEREILSAELMDKALDLSLEPEDLSGQVMMLAKDLRTDAESAGAQSMPSSLSGTLIQPTGAPGAGLAVSLRRSGGDDGMTPLSAGVVVSDQGGRFSLAPGDTAFPEAGIELLVQGGDTRTTIVLGAAEVQVGRLGTLTLDRPLAPLPDSVRQDLSGAGHANDHAVRLGEGENCARRFSSNAGVIDRYSWSTLIRLVEPKVFPPQGKTEAGDGVPTAPTTALDTLVYRTGADRVGMRVPIGAPIDVDAFRRDLEEDPANVPKAGTVGLGYVLRMTQAWIPRGLSLGNLLYSLPLAPGEEQRVIVSESVERLTVRERERAALSQRQSQSDRVARTTSQVFNSSLADEARGGSAFESSSESGNFGGGFSILGFGLSGGRSSTSTSGSSSSWQRSSRDFASFAAESFHSNLSRRAAVSRQVSNVSVRLATLEDRDEVGSKLVANRNRNHALTLQFWEVLRNFTVTSDVADVSLVCFVPLEIIPWTVAQSTDGADGGLASSVSRDYLVRRYSTILRHAEVLRRRLRFSPRLRRALRKIEELSANPMIAVDSESEARTLSLRIAATGTFLPFDHLAGTVVLNDGRRIGPAWMTPASVEEPVAREAINRGDVVDALLARRADTAGAESTRAAFVVLPPAVSAADIARFEITHRISSWTFRPPDLNALDPQDEGTIEARFVRRPERRDPIRFSARALTQQVGAPEVWDIEVETLDGDGDVVAQDLDGTPSARRMPGRLIVTPDPEDPVFGREELQLAEELLAHLRENALGFSKAVWAEMSPDELVMMLEPHTVGLPLGDGTLSEIPLVSCISTGVLGFFGNSMVLPFHIPAQMAAESGTTSGEIESELTRFHRQSFRPPRTEIAMSAGGMLGEAVLGACDSAEEIDLTRLWNWKDAPLPRRADDPNGVTFGGERLVGSGAAQAANRLSGVAAPSYDIGPSALPASALDLAALLSKIPASQLPDDLDASELAKAFAAQGLTNAVDIARGAVGSIMEANAATGPSVKDVLNLSKAIDNRMTSNLAALQGDPGSFAERIGNAPEGERDNVAKSTVADLTGGKDMSAAQQAGVFKSLSGIAGGSGAKAIGAKALLAAFGLPLI